MFLQEFLNHENEMKKFTEMISYSFFTEIISPLVLIGIISIKPKGLVFLWQETYSSCIKKMYREYFLTLQEYSNLMDKIFSALFITHKFWANFSMKSYLIQ